MNVCAWPTCAALVDRGYCDEHASDGRKQAARDRAEAYPPKPRDPRSVKHKAPVGRPSAAERGYDARWRRTRARYLQVHPRCQRCGKPAVDVHHKDGLGPLGPLGHTWSNLEALCKPCHSAHTASTTGWPTKGDR